jgi:hypothetical protein
MAGKERWSWNDQISWAAAIETILIRLSLCIWMREAAIDLPGQAISMGFLPIPKKVRIPKSRARLPQIRSHPVQTDGFRTDSSAPSPTKATLPSAIPRGFADRGH